MANDWRVLIDDTGGPFTGWPEVWSDEEDRCILHRAGFKQEYWDGPSLHEAKEIAQLVVAYMNTTRRHKGIAKGSVGLTRNMQRLERLAESAAAKPAGNERDLIVRTLMKILDECGDDEYDSVMGDAMLVEKLAAVGITFDDTVQEPTADT